MANGMGVSGPPPTFSEALEVLAKVVLPNDFFPVGTFVDITGNDAQKVRVYTEDGRLQTGGFEGLVYPADKVRPYVFMLLKRGFDDQGAFKTARQVTLN
jgi:hypothetical protein